jgi:hypothetical protein
MAKVTAPLLSMGARGQIGKAMVLGSWRGISYARQYVVPANPKTTAQTANRTRFALLREMWKLAPAILREPFDAFATGRKFTGMNAFVGENNRILKSETDLSAILGSPGARGGLPPGGVTVAATAVAGEVELTFDLPDQLPDGWSVLEIAGAAFANQDPTGIFSPPLIAGKEAAPETVLVLAGLPADTECVGVGWIVYEKPDGTKAYSVSLAGLATTAA